MRQDSTIEAFFILTRAGLFGRTEHIDSMQLDDVDWAEVCHLAEKQSMVGLVEEGVELIQDEWFRVHGTSLVPKKWAVQLVAATMQLEQYNLAMNKFIARLVRKLRKNDIHTLLVKGQGVALSYNKPLWRACGDVDLLLSEENYQRAKSFLLPFASYSEPENPYKKHFGLKIGGWGVELHGSLRCGFSSRIDKELDIMCHETFNGGNVTSWMNRKVEIFSLGKENHVLYVFVHFLNHFYKGGVGLKQICDWCRLLWSSKDSLDLGRLESRLKDMKLMSEWRAFGMYAVQYLGMPENALPFYSNSEKWKHKAKRIHLFIMETGYMGVNREKSPNTYLSRKVKSSKQRFRDLANHLMIFPLDTIRFFPSILLNGIRQK